MSWARNWSNSFQTQAVLVLCCCKTNQALLPCSRYHLSLFKNSSPEMLYSVDPALDHLILIWSIWNVETAIYISKENSPDIGWELLCLNAQVLTLKWLFQFTPLCLTYQQHLTHFFLLRRMALVTFKANGERTGRQPSQQVPNSLCQSL